MIDEISLEEFEEKFKDADRLIAKRRVGKGGKGIAVFDTSEVGYKEIYEDRTGRKFDLKYLV